MQPRYNEIKDIQEILCKTKPATYGKRSMIQLMKNSQPEQCLMFLFRFIYMCINIENVRKDTYVTGDEGHLNVEDCRGR